MLTLFKRNYSYASALLKNIPKDPSSKPAYLVKKKIRTGKKVKFRIFKEDEHAKYTLPSISDLLTLYRVRAISSLSQNFIFDTNINGSFFVTNLTNLIIF